jgi:hypothetical protein
MLPRGVKSVAQYCGRLGFLFGAEEDVAGELKIIILDWEQSQQHDYTGSAIPFRRGGQWVIVQPLYRGHTML